MPFDFTAKLDAKSFKIKQAAAYQLLRELIENQDTKLTNLTSAFREADKMRFFSNDATVADLNMGESQPAKRKKKSRLSDVQKAEIVDRGVAAVQESRELKKSELVTAMKITNSEWYNWARRDLLDRAEVTLVGRKNAARYVASAKKKASKPKTKTKKVTKKKMK